MPEGDTIHRIARNLARVLVGETFVAARSFRVDAESLVGRSVVSVEAHGKHLIIGLDDGRAIHTHLRMRGSWKLYPSNDTNAPHYRDPDLEVSTISWRATCLTPATLRIEATERLRRALALHLGCDPLRTSLDAKTTAVALRESGHASMGEALLGQRILAGLGNVYKSELLFIHRVDPFASPANVDVTKLEALLEDAARLLRANLDTRGRTTTGRDRAGERLYVYERSGLPCRECGEPVRMRRQGAGARSTYFCSRCQGVVKAT